MHWLKQIDNVDEAAGIEKLLGLVSIPVASVLFTYAHIWLALWMMFYPIDFLGKWQLKPYVNFGLGALAAVARSFELLAPFCSPHPLCTQAGKVFCPSRFATPPSAPLA